MANNKNPDAFKLPKAVFDQLDAMSTNIEAAEATIKTLQKLGMDTKDIEEKLVWAKNVRETLLTDFS